jgi:hypothetical protein
MGGGDYWGGDDEGGHWGDENAAGLEAEQDSVGVPAPLGLDMVEMPKRVAGEQVC